MDRCHNQRRCDCLLIIYADLRDDARHRFNLSRTRVSAGRAIRKANAFRVNLRHLDNFRLIKNVFVGGARLRFVLRGAIKTRYGSFFLFPWEVGAGRVTNSVLCLTLNPLLRTLPYPHSRAIRAEEFTVLTPVLTSLIGQVSKGGGRIIVLVGSFCRLPRHVASKGIGRAARLARAVICVSCVVSSVRFLRLLRKGDGLSATYLITPRVVFVGPIRGLIINGATGLRIFVQGTTVRDLVCQYGCGSKDLILGGYYRPFDLFHQVNRCVWNMSFFRGVKGKIIRRIGILVVCQLKELVGVRRGLERSAQFISRFCPLGVRRIPR